MQPIQELRNIINDAPEDEFIDFLLFCVDGLNRDEPVQAIWSDWLVLVEKK